MHRFIFIFFLKKMSNGHFKCGLKLNAGYLLAIRRNASRSYGVINPERMRRSTAAFAYTNAMPAGLHLNVGYRLVHIRVLLALENDDGTDSKSADAANGNEGNEGNAAAGV